MGTTNEVYQRESRFKFEGYFKSRVNVISIVVSSVIVFLIGIFIFHLSLLFILFTIIPFILITISNIIYKSKKSQIILTEYHCTIIECKFFGIIKVHKSFDILEEEQETLINYFNFLESKKNEVYTFSIESVNEIVKNSIIFKNKNLVKI